MVIGKQWSSIHASVCGQAHTKSGLNNQDSCLCQQEADFLVQIVSDGMGSCKNAKEGAEASCQAVLKIIKEYIKDGNESDVFSHPYTFLEEIYRARAEMLCQYGLDNTNSTCLFIIVFSDRVFMAQLGDGILIAFDEEGIPVCLLEDSKNDKFLNETDGFNSVFQEENWKIALLSTKHISGAMLCTDGVELESSMDYVRLAHDIFTICQHSSNGICEAELVKFLSQWPEHSNQDDKTLAFIYRSLANEDK